MSVNLRQFAGSERGECIRLYPPNKPYCFPRTVVRGARYPGGCGHGGGGESGCRRPCRSPVIRPVSVLVSGLLSPRVIGGGAS